VLATFLELEFNEATRLCPVFALISVVSFTLIFNLRLISRPQ